MPTENRSSNTEMAAKLSPCPFCGQKDFLIERLDSDASVVICQGLAGPHEACLARGPVGVAQDEGEEQPGRDKAVELWNARAEQIQVEPVAVLYADGTVLTKADCGDAFATCCKVETPLYTRADPGEVERLRNATAFVQRLVDCAGSQQSVAAGYLRDILDVLKGNPVPSAPVERDERAAFEKWYLAEYYEGDAQCGLEWLSTEPCGGYRYSEPARHWKVWQARAALERKP